MKQIRHKENSQFQGFLAELHRLLRKKLFLLHIMFDQDARFADIMIDSLDNKWGTAERFESRFHSQILAIIESGVSRGELPQQNTEELARNFHESFKFLTNPIFLRQLSSKDQKAKLDQTFRFLATNLK